MKAASVTCPNPDCDRAFVCDMCFHQHLMRRHNLRLSDVFGRTPDSLAEFCAEHAASPPSLLGL